jgi:hypothetical protein
MKDTPRSPRADPRTHPKERINQIKQWARETEPLGVAITVLGLERAIDTLFEIAPESERREQAARLIATAYAEIAEGT